MVRPPCRSRPGLRGHAATLPGTGGSPARGLKRHCEIASATPSRHRLRIVFDDLALTI
jgi:hypothetical protein